MTDQPDELDKLLEEAKPDDKPTLQLLQGIRKDLEEVKAASETDRKEKTQADVQEVVKALREKVPEPFRNLDAYSDSALEDYLNRQATQNKDLENAFLGRHTNASVWDQARGGLMESFAKQFENLPDPALSEDREAVMASAKQSQPAKEPEFDEKAVGDMSTEDFNKLQRDLGVAPFGG